MVRVTDDKEVKETVLAGLRRNKEKYGKRYCPCSLVRNDDTVCVRSLERWKRVCATVNYM